MVKNRGLCFLCQKNTKKAAIRSNFAEFSRNRLRAEIHDYGLKMFLEVLKFFSVLQFFKNDISKEVIADQKSWGLFAHLGVAGVNDLLSFI